MAQQTHLNIDHLRSAIQDEYTEVADKPTKGFHFHTGRFLASRLGYPTDLVDQLPDAAVESFAGVGNPFSWGAPNPGETVLDMGSGAGFDALLAAYTVGPEGKAIGIDMTPSMLAKARQNAATLGLDNAEFREGYLESMPVDDESVDMVISNGVLNLCPDKPSVLAEANRVLRPGGRLQMSDIVISKEVPDDAKSDVSLWTECIAGALLGGEFRSNLEGAGFTGITFSDAPQESSAEAFGTQGVDILAVKPGGDTARAT